jgi:hypothetical protein
MLVMYGMLTYMYVLMKDYCSPVPGAGSVSLLPGQPHHPCNMSRQQPSFFFSGFPPNLLSMYCYASDHTHPPQPPSHQNCPFLVTCNCNQDVSGARETTCNPGYALDPAFHCEMLTCCLAM